RRSRRRPTARGGRTGPCARGRASAGSRRSGSSRRTPRARVGASNGRRRARGSPRRSNAGSYTAAGAQAERTTVSMITGLMTLKEAVTGVDPRRWEALPVILVATFMGLFDVFVVNVAAPDIEQNLGASASDLQL